VIVIAGLKRLVSADTRSQARRSSAGFVFVHEEATGRSILHSSISSTARHHRTRGFWQVDHQAHRTLASIYATAGAGN